MGERSAVLQPPIVGRHRVEARPCREPCADRRDFRGEEGLLLRGPQVPGHLGLRLREVRLRVENPTGELRPGMSGWAKIDCGRRPLGAVLLRRVSRYLRTEVWSWF